MVDRPTLEELIDAARMHIETEVIPAIKGDAKLYFQTLVAINVLRVAERELTLGWSHLQAEWRRLDRLEGEAQIMPASPTEAAAALRVRNAGLCGRIRAGAYDAKAGELVAHLRATVREALEVANPKFLQTVESEKPASAV
ncbi:MAG: hypothetical protein IAE80_13080 [Anaerolinea sp.]|nr:hypothetical protein [Anaerolinea sp.]